MKNLLVVSVITLFSINAYAQPGSGYARRAIEDKYEKDNAGNKAKGMDWLNGAMNGKTELSYSFATMINMHITTHNDGDTKENDAQYFLTSAGSSQKYFGMKANNEHSRKRDADMFIIYDNGNKSMVMLNEKEQTGMAMNINSFMSKEAQDKRDHPENINSTMKCSKTGKTKNIKGYSCFEFVCVDEDRNTKTEAWVTTDLKVDISQSLSKGPLSGFGNSGAGGFLMEGNFYKNNELRTKMEVTEVDTKANITKTMSDYKMGMR